jgi:hypothetical protein
MFGAEHGGGSECVDTFERGGHQSDRRQYTLKGVEAETLELMRDAARKEGMKIGSWVSVRMREAAQRALEAETARDERIRADEHESVPLLVEKLYEAFALYKQHSEDRLARMERELHEITSGQRAIMTSLLCSRAADHANG